MSMIEALTKSADAILAAFGGDTPEYLRSEAAALAEAVATAKAATADPADIRRAIAAYGSDDIEIDDDALTSVSDHGLWVQAWVHLRHDD